ncbi:hypothetical protein IJ182_08145 [bacterium]|nr:hypothetical protein [bacterium]
MQIDNMKRQALFLGIISGIYINFRTEFLPLAIYIPFMIFMLKIFSNSKYKLYLLTFILTFSSIFAFQAINVNQKYELHNLSFIYTKIKINKINYPIIDKYEPLIIKVFGQFYETGFEFDKLDTSNKENNNIVKKVLMKAMIDNAPFLIKKNLNLYINGPTIIILPTQHEVPEKLMKKLKIKILNKTIRNKVIEYFIYFHKYKHNNVKIYNPLINFSILGLLTIIGIIRKKYFYVWYSLSWTIVISVLLLTIPWNNYMYLWGFFFNTHFFLFLLIIIFLQNKQNSQKNKQMQIK